MVAIAHLRNAKTSAQKARLVADLVRGKSVNQAMDILKFSTKKAAVFVRKTLNSAISNAENNAGADIDSLKVKTILVDEGPSAKRFHARARGRGDRIIKRSCHITVTVAE